jgi:hypothetical protein
MIMGDFVWKMEGASGQNRKGVNRMKGMKKKGRVGDEARPKPSSMDC